MQKTFLMFTGTDLSKHQSIALYIPPTIVLLIQLKHRMLCSRGLCSNVFMKADMIWKSLFTTHYCCSSVYESSL
uniref:Uncharacterized protein n=1 Tax=Anguilla anguilla TaxID=7936 RepID=A0A0E9VQF5_ANGAN